MTPETIVRSSLHAKLENCFLCDPDHELLCWQGASFNVVAGLGPVVDGFCLVSTNEHIPSMADVGTALATTRDSTIASIRKAVTHRFGSCLVTEHGRVPVCREDGDQHSAHCFHAHFLLFPGADDITPAALSYYRHSKEFESGADAMHYASSASNYLYISPTDLEHLVLTGPLNAPRQLARTLVALTTGRIDLADWQMSPNRQRAQEIAKELGQLLDEMDLVG